MKKIQIFLAAVIVLAVGSFMFAPVGNVSAASPFEEVCADNADNTVCQNRNDSSDSFIKNIVNTLLFVLGALSVLVIIIGGIMYATSQGNSSNVTKAKNTLVFAIVGLVVAFLGYAIVNWVFQLF